MRGSGADCLVVAMKPCNGGGAKGAGCPGSFGGQPDVLGRSQVSESKSQDKPFEISKWMVWEAYQQGQGQQGRGRCGRASRSSSSSRI